jgi:hypothetical protein
MIKFTRSERKKASSTILLYILICLSLYEWVKYTVIEYIFFFFFLLRHFDAIDFDQTSNDALSLWYLVLYICRKKCRWMLYSKDSEDMTIATSIDGYSAVALAGTTVF